ncbi:MAG TPA: outer membrane beta-barrel protein [Gemmatimonadales bacterium]|nr:outer membrane beta-barrel protein [Gemmatimonadales bacterium]
MRSALWCALLCGLAVPAGAQEREVTFEEPQPVTITGFAVGRGDYDRTARANGFTAGKLALSLFKSAGDAYVFAQLTTALADGEASTEIDNLIVSWTPRAASRWTLALGRFDAPIGFERDDEPLNFLPTSSFNFELARPAKLSGGVVRFTASPRFELVLGAVNGWNVAVDNNRGKTALARAQWLPVERLAIAVTGVYGPERNATDAHQRTLLSGDLTVDAGRVIVGAEASFGREPDQPASVSWGGGTLTAFLRVGPSVGISGRYDHLEDSGGALTGTPQVLRSVTVGPMWFFRRAQEGIFSNVEHTTFHLPQVAIRAALRLDRSSQPFFETSGPGLERTDTRGVVEVVYLF